MQLSKEEKEGEGVCGEITVGYHNLLLPFLSNSQTILPPHPLGPGLFLLSAQGLPNTCCTYTYKQSYAGIIWEGKERIIAGGVGRGVEKIFLTAGSEFVPQGDLSSPFSRRLLPRLYLLSFMPSPISLTATDEGRKMRLRHSNKSSTSGPKRKVNLFSSSLFRVVEYGKLPIAKKPWARVFPFCGRN